MLLNPLTKKKMSKIHVLISQRAEGTDVTHEQIEEALS